MLYRVKQLAVEPTPDFFLSGSLPVWSQSVDLHLMLNPPGVDTPRELIAKGLIRRLVLIAL